MICSFVMKTTHMNTSLQRGIIAAAKTLLVGLIVPRDVHQTPEDVVAPSYEKYLAFQEGSDR